MKALLEKIRKILRSRRTRQLLTRAVSGVAAVVVFVTTYALVLPAITLEQDAFCGIPEHQHTDACYEERLVCEIPEGEDHHHDTSCYEKFLICGQEVHVHSTECYKQDSSAVVSSGSGAAASTSLDAFAEPDAYETDGSEYGTETVVTDSAAASQSFMEEPVDEDAVSDQAATEATGEADLVSGDLTAEGTDGGEDIPEKVTENVPENVSEAASDGSDNVEYGLEVTEQENPENSAGVGDSDLAADSSQDLTDTDLETAGSGSSESIDTDTTNPEDTEGKDSEEDRTAADSFEEADDGPTEQVNGGGENLSQESGDSLDMNEDPVPGTDSLELSDTSDRAAEDIEDFVGAQEEDTAPAAATEEAANDATTNVLPEPVETESLSSGYVPELDSVEFGTVLNKHTDFYYFHPEEGQEIPASSAEVTDWKKVKNGLFGSTKLESTDLVKVYLSYTIPAGALNETNQVARYRLPSNIHLTDDQIIAINSTENGMSALYADDAVKEDENAADEADDETYTEGSEADNVEGIQEDAGIASGTDGKEEADDAESVSNALEQAQDENAANHQKYLGAEAIEGTRTPDEKLKEGAQEYISAIVKAENVFDEEGLYGEKGAFLGQDLIFIFTPYSIEKNQTIYNADGDPLSAGEKITGWFACDFNMSQIDWVEEDTDLDNSTVEKTAEVVFVEKDSEKNVKEISRTLKLVDVAEGQSDAAYGWETAAVAETAATAETAAVSETAVAAEIAARVATASETAATDESAFASTGNTSEQAVPEESEDGSFKSGTLTADGDGYKITLDYTEEAKIPENAELSVREITAETDKEAYEACLEQAGQQVASDEKTSVDQKASRFFDIEILVKDTENNDQGETHKIEPAAPVSVNIQIIDSPAAEDAASGNEETDRNDPAVLHFAEEGVEQIDSTVKTGQELEDNEDRNVSGESEPATEISFEAESFSIYGVVYTVDFHWEADGNVYEFTLPGGGFVRLDALLEALGIVDADMYGSKEEFIADIDSVEFSNPELVWVGCAGNNESVGALKDANNLECEYSAELTDAQIRKINDTVVKAGDWVLIGLRPFETTETLTITMKDGEVFTVRVTDAQIKQTVIDNRGDTWEITVTYDDSAEIPDGAELKVQEVVEGTAAYRNYLSDSAIKLGADSDALSFARFFDITIIDKDGKQVEPKTAVQVEIRYKDAIEVGDGEALSVVHFAKDGTEIIEPDVADESWNFEAKSFSVYGTIVAEASDDLSGMTFTISKDGNYLTTDLVPGSQISNTRQFRKDSDQEDAAVWEFEAAPTTGQYYIFTNIDGEKKYMSFEPNTTDTRRAHAELSNTPQAFTVISNTDGTFKFRTNVNNTNYYLNEHPGGEGFAAWHAESQNGNANDRFNINFTQPILTPDDEYMVLIKIGEQYYIVLNNGELEETEYPVDGYPNTVGAETPMLWNYTGDVLYHEAKEVAFNNRQVASDYYYRYIDPRSDDGLVMDDVNNTTQEPAYPWGGFNVTGRDLMTEAKITYSDHTIASVSEPSKVLKVVEENGKLKIAGGDTEGETAEVYLARLTDYNNLKIGAKYHAVDHIDISVEGRAGLNAPLAYGTYYYMEGGQLKTLIVSKESPVTLSLSNSSVDITNEDIKKGKLVAYTKEEDGSVKELDNAFVILGYSGNAEAYSGAGQSTAQVRIDGTFKVADLPPVSSGDGNYDENIRQQRLANRIYYSLSTAKEVDFDLKYNGHQLYATAEDAQNDVTAHKLQTSATITMSNSFDYWDSRNECPGIWFMNENSVRWKAGDVLCSTSRDMNQGNSGMDFSLGTAAGGEPGILAVEITKFVVDQNGHAITPNQQIKNLFHVYQKIINKDATPNPANEVKDLNVDEYDAEADQPDYTTSYVKTLDKEVVVGEGGMGAVYDYDVSAGMVYIEEDTSEKNLPRTITDEDGRIWYYKQTHLETEYVWRGDGIEERRHFSKDYALSDENQEHFFSIPEVLGDYKDVNSIDRYNGFLEFYVYNVYEPEPTDIKVEKVWEYQDGSPADAPSGAVVTATLGRYKLIDDPDNPVTGDLVIRQTVLGNDEGISAFEATYKVKQGDTVVRTAKYNSQTGGAVITGLPGGTYTVEISSSAEGYDVTDTPASNTVVIVNGHTIANNNATETSFSSNVAAIVNPVKTVNVRVTNTIGGNPNYQDLNYTFPGGSRIVVNITRPGPAHNNNIGITVTTNSNGTSASYPYHGPTGDGYASVNQNLYFTLPADGSYEIDISHQWGPQDVWINSVSIYADSGNGTNSNSPMFFGRRLSGNLLGASRGQNNEDVPLTESTAPESPVPGMKYVVDEDWSTEEVPVNVELSGITWSRVVPDLEAVDENGNKYLYFIKSVNEEGVPDGTTMTIEMNGEKVLTSSGEAVLTVTNKLPDEPPDNPKKEKALEVEKMWVGDKDHPNQVVFTVNATYDNGSGLLQPYTVPALKEADGVTDRRFILNETNGWYTDIDHLPSETADGKFIFYSIEEEHVDGYVLTEVKDLTTETYHYCDVDAVKLWDDSSTHTEIINVRLKNSAGDYYSGVDAQGEAIFGAVGSAQTFTLNPDNSYTHCFERLPAGDVYTIEQVGGQTDYSETLVTRVRNIIQYQLVNSPVGQDVDPNGGQDNPEIHKRIDALRDNVANPDSDHEGEELTDLYRLYLDYKINSLQEANGVDLLFVIDHSGSMNNSAWQGNPYRAPAVMSALNGADGLIAEFLNMDDRNQWAAVGFKGPDGAVDYWPSLFSAWPPRTNYARYNAGLNGSEVLSPGGTSYVFTRDDVTPLDNVTIANEGANILTNYTAGLWRAEQFLLQQGVKDDGRKKVIIFISDGIPTLHIDCPSETLQNAGAAAGSNYYRDDYGGCPDETLTEFGYFVNDMKDYGYVFGDTMEFYTVGFGGTMQTTAGAALLNGMLDIAYGETEHTGHFMTVSDPVNSNIEGASGKLKDDLRAIMGLDETFTNIVIQDNLSKYVDLYGPAAAGSDTAAIMRAANAKVTMTVPDPNSAGQTQTITLYENGAPVNADNAKFTRADGSTKANIITELRYDPTEKTVQAVFDSEYQAVEGVTYTLSFDVKTTDQAYTTYAAGGYDKYTSGSKEGQVITGDEDTDYLGTNPANTTSTDKPGFRSNDQASASYKHNGTDESKDYTHPVIQVFNAEIWMLKTDQTGAPLENAEFALYRNAYDASGTEAAQTANAANQVKSGLQSSLKGEAPDQVAEISVEKLKPGTYYLVETKAPDGYMQIEPVKIVVAVQTTISNSGTSDTVTVTASVGGNTVGGDKLYKNGDKWILEVMNSSGVELPATGGPGTNMLYLLGITLISLAGAGLVMKRRWTKAA